MERRSNRDDTYDGAPTNLGCYVINKPRASRWHATDGSGTIFIYDNPNAGFAGTLITGDGTRYRFDTNLGLATSITDRNGNFITINRSVDPNTGRITAEYIDQLGRSTKVELNALDPVNHSTLAALVTFKGYQDSALHLNPQYYKVKTDAVGNHIRSDFNYNHQPILTGSSDPFGVCYQWGQPPAANYLFPESYCEDQQRIDNQKQVNELDLPDGRSLHFNYNLYGEVAEVILPTGAKLQYDYAGSMSGLPSGNTLSWEYLGQFGAAYNIDRSVVARRTYPDGSTLEGTWTYAFGPQTVNGGSYACSEVKAFQGNPTPGTLLLDQRHFFLPALRYLYQDQYSSTGTGYSLWSTGVEWRTEIRNAAGGVISATEHDWAQRISVNFNQGYGAGEQPANDNRVSETRHYLDTGSSSKTDIFYDNTNYPRANNVSETKEYDFDQSLKRRSTTSYVTGSYQSDDSIHLLSLEQQQSVYASDGTTEMARTINEYDVYTKDGNHDNLQDYGSVIGHDSNYGSSKTSRGNLTAVGHWLKTNNTIIYSYLRYDTLGNPVGSKDGNGNLTTLSYTDDFGDGSSPGNGATGNNGATYAFPTLLTSPPPQSGQSTQTAYSQYDFSTGLLTGFKDRNSGKKQTIYNDPFNRPTQIRAAVGVTGTETHSVIYYAQSSPITIYGVTLTNNDVLTAKDQTSLDDAMLRSWTHTDGFGRTIESWSGDPLGDDKVATIYDALGRVKQVSNPFRPSLGQTAVYTTTGYDLAGRLTFVTTPDSAAVTTSYSGNTVTVTDQAIKSRKSVTDGLGRLIQIYEAPNDSNYNYLTNYAYDALDNLTSVTQGTQPQRSFQYDSLKRLTSATNPESGTINYKYDNDGNLLVKTDARSVSAHYAYDALNRPNRRWYNGSNSLNDVTNNIPALPSGVGASDEVNYTYDSAAVANAKGRLVSVSSSVSTYSFSGYDAFGRVTGGTQTLGGQNYSLSYTYDLAGHLKSMTYPSLHAVNYTFDVAGRLSDSGSNLAFTGNLGDGVTRTYASISGANAYDAASRIQEEKFGTSTPLYHKQHFTSAANSMTSD